MSAPNKKLKLIELTIPEDFHSFNFDEAWAFVDKPAIEEDFYYFASDFEFNDEPPVHPNCNCYIENGVWNFVYQGIYPCPNCIEAAENWEASGKKEEMRKINFNGIDLSTLKFNKEKFVKPNAGEKQKDFLPRCIETVMNDGTTDDNKQAAAICYSYWKDKDKMGEEVLAPPYKAEVPKKKKIDDKVKTALVKLVKILGRPQENLFSNTIKYNYQHMNEEQEDWTFHVEYKYMKKLFSLEEVYEMHNILSAYMKPEENVFTFEGTSPWIQVKYMKSPEGKIKILSQTRIKSKREEVKSEMFRFVDEEQGIAIGYLMVPDKHIPRIDPTTNEPYECFFSKETIAMIAEKFMYDNKMNNANVMHEADAPAKVTCIETWIVEDAAMDKVNLYFNKAIEGAWVIKVRVNDKDLRSKIKSKEFRGFSIEGLFSKMIPK